MSNRIAVLETVVEQHSRLAVDFEKRIRAVERAVYIASGGLALLQIILKFSH